MDNHRKLLLVKVVNIVRVRGPNIKKGKKKKIRWSF
jgi:hypothetical protein